MDFSTFSQIVQTQNLTSAREQINSDVDYVHEEEHDNSESHHDVILVYSGKLK